MADSFLSMYDKNHYNIVISLQLIKINGGKKNLFPSLPGRILRINVNKMLSPCFTPDCCYSNASSSFHCLVCHYTQMQHEALSLAYYIPNYWTKSIYQHDTELHPGHRILPVLVPQLTLSLQSQNLQKWGAQQHSGSEHRLQRPWLQQLLTGWLWQAA